jgi:hypothetical protein
VTEQGVEGVVVAAAGGGGLTRAKGDAWPLAGASSDSLQWLGMGVACIGMAVGVVSQVCALVMPSL